MSLQELEVLHCLCGHDETEHYGEPYTTINEKVDINSVENNSFFNESQ